MQNLRLIMPRRKIIAVMIGQMLALPVWAQSSSLSKIEVPAATEKPTQVTLGASSHLVITQQDLQSDASASLGEQLARLPGVNNLATGSQAGNPVVRGVTGERLNVMSQGHAMEYQAYGTRHPANIEPWFADSISLIRGADALKYAGQSTAGVVNIESITPHYQEGWHGRIAAEYNSNNAESLLGAQLQTAHQGWGLVLAATKRDGDDYYSATSANAGEPIRGDAANTRPLVTGKTPYTDFKQRNARVGLGYQGDWGQVEVLHTHWHSQQNYLGVSTAPPPNPAGPYRLVPSAGQDLSNQETQLQAKLNLNEVWTLEPSYSYTRNQRTAMGGETYQHLNRFKNDPDLLDIVVKRHEAKLALQHQPLLNGWQGEIGVAGYQAHQDLRSGTLSPNAYQQGQGLYWVEKTQFDRWEFEVGARFDHHQVRAPMSEANRYFWQTVNIYDAHNHERTFSGWSGALGASYLINANLQINAQLNRSFRAPGVFELYAGGVHGGVQAFQLGNPDLKAETGLNSELGLSWQSDTLMANFSVYQQALDNYITLENTGRFRNAQGQVVPQSPLPEMQNRQTRAQIRGAELNLNYQLTQHWHWMFDAELIAGRDLDNRRDLPLIPANNAQLSTQYHFNLANQPSYTRLSSQYVAAKDIAGNFEPFAQFEQTPFGTASTSAYWLWHWHAGIEFNLRQQRKLHLDLGVQNLLDTAYRDFLDTYKGYAQGMGRNIKLSANMTF